MAEREPNDTDTDDCVCSYEPRRNVSDDRDWDLGKGTRRPHAGSVYGEKKKKEAEREKGEEKKGWRTAQQQM
jgi:hypothetical protein